MDKTLPCRHLQRPSRFKATCCLGTAVQAWLHHSRQALLPLGSALCVVGLTCRFSLGSWCHRGLGATMRAPCWLAHMTEICQLRGRQVITMRYSRGACSQDMHALSERLCSDVLQGGGRVARTISYQIRLHGLDMQCERSGASRLAGLQWVTGNTL